MGLSLLPYSVLTAAILLLQAKAILDVMVEFSEPGGIRLIDPAYELEEIHNTKWTLYPAME